MQAQKRKFSLNENGYPDLRKGVIHHTCFYIMELVEKQVTNANSLYKAALKTRKSAPKKYEVQRFMRDVLIEIDYAIDDVRKRTWKLTLVNPFIINERGHIRKIEGNIPYDRMILHSYIDNGLSPILDPYLSYDNYASQKGKGVKLARDRFANMMHRAYRLYGDNKFYVLEIDFSKFYDNIQHQLLYDKIIEKTGYSKFHKYMLWTIFENFKVDVSYMSYSEYLACLDRMYVALDHIHDKPVGKYYMYKSIKIGNPASQVFSIFYPTEIDNFLRIVEGNRLTGRYMDDTVILHNDLQYLYDILSKVEEKCFKMGIFINRKKTKIYEVDKNFIYLNHIYRLNNNGHLFEHLEPTTIYRERQKIKKFPELISDGSMTKEKAIQQFSSWRGSFYPYMTRKQRQNMTELFNKTLNCERITIIKSLL